MNFACLNRGLHPPPSPANYATKKNQSVYIKLLLQSSL
jgi:hypothetical protein